MRIKARGAVAASAIALIGSLLAAAPAEANHAEPGRHVYGHRCVVGKWEVNNENTVAALRELQGLPGAKCEIDAVRISDGTVIVWHDATWHRVADPETLPTGVEPDHPVVSATREQVSQIRTRGGQPVPTLRQMIVASAQYGVPLVVDIRNELPARRLVRIAKKRDARVSYYQLMRPSCSTRHIDRFRAAGATVGVKLLGDCPMRPAEIQAAGATFTQEHGFDLTDRRLARLRSRGISVGVLDGGMTERDAESLVARGVSRVLLDKPLEALNWFDAD